jgi:branched-chain amino acid transport system substrate-binding protein
VPAPARRQVAMFGVVFLLGCTPLLAGCTKKSHPPKSPATVTIGLLTATSGDAAAADRPAVQGAELAVDLVNATHPELSLPFAASAGLSHGTKLVLTTADTKGDPATGGPITDRVLRESHPAGLVVADSTETAKAVGQHSEDAATPLLDAGSSADALGQMDRQWYFRTGPTDQMLLSAALDAVRQVAGTPVAGTPAGGSGDPATITVRKLVVLDGASRLLDGAPDLPDVAQSHGFAVAGRLPVNPANGGPSELADKIGNLKPDALLALVGTDQEAGLVNEAIQKLKSNVTAVALGPGVGGLGTGLRGIMRVVTWSGDFAGRNPVARAVNQIYQQRYGTTMNEAAAGAFMAVLTLAVAVDGAIAAGGLDPVRVRAALRQTDLRATETIMPWDGVQFDAAGQNPLAAGLVEQRNGSAFQVVFPRELAPRVSAP